MTPVSVAESVTEPARLMVLAESVVVITTTGRVVAVMSEKPKLDEWTDVSPG